jgi:cysteine desulfurase
VPPIYCDYNATTPLDPAVRAVMDRVQDQAWANPSSIHGPGRAARAVLDEARYRLAARWRCRPSEVVFTGGGTEANNLAVLGTSRHLRERGRHLVVSSVEHPAVLQAFRHLATHEGFTVTFLPVDATGRVDPDAVLQALRPDTILVSVMAANNEVGTVQPVAAIGELCRARGIRFHTDAVQALGKLPFTDMAQFQADLVTVCAHKFHGPKGAGALYIRSPLLPQATQMGGSQENERRAGTENLPAIAGLVEAFERFVPQPVFHPATLHPLLSRLTDLVRGLPGVTVRSPAEGGLPNTLSFSVTRTDSIALLANLDLAGVCASSGSACAAGSLEPSHVLQAMGVPTAECQSLVRLSLGRENTAEEIDQICTALPPALHRAR